jgi:hypothetical protein
MSTHPLRARHVVWPSTGFARIVSAIRTMFDAFAEVQRQARAAHARFPFADW